MVCLFELSLNARIRPLRSTVHFIACEVGISAIVIINESSKTSGRNEPTKCEDPKLPASYQATISANSASGSCPIGKVPLPQRLPTKTSYQEIPT